jgi:hypothetical protein
MPGPRATGMFVRNPKRKELMPEIAAVAVMKFRWRSEH